MVATVVALGGVPTAGTSCRTGDGALVTCVGGAASEIALGRVGVGAPTMSEERFTSAGSELAAMGVDTPASAKPACALITSSLARRKTREVNEEE